MGIIWIFLHPLCYKKAFIYPTTNMSPILATLGNDPLAVPWYGIAESNPDVAGWNDRCKRP